MSRLKMIFLILMPIIIILGTALSIYSWWTLKAGIKETREKIDFLITDHAREIRSKTNEIARQIGITADTIRDPSGTVSSYLENVIKTNPSIQALVIAYDPAFLKRLQKGDFPEYHLENHFNILKSKEYPDFYCPLIYRGEKTRFVYTDFKDQLYMNREWYHLARISGKSAWGDPFFSYITNTYVCPYSIPFYYKGIFIGVLSAFVRGDELFDNSDLESYFSKQKYKGEICVLAGNGKFIYHTTKAHISKHNVYTLLAERNQTDLFPLVDQFFSGLNDAFRIDNFQLTDLKGKPSAFWFVFTPIRNDTDYILLVTLNENELFTSFYLNLVYIWGIGVLFIFLLGLVMYKIFNMIFSPLEEISRVADLVSKGNFDVRAQNPFHEQKGEIYNLFNNFNSMIGGLKIQFEKIREEQNQRSVMEGNLRAARDIQTAFMPNKRPFFTDPEFHIDAMLLPAREVAGDFFDLWKVDDDTVAIVVGDVSGKGITAAMIMIAVRTMIRQIEHHFHSPGDIISEVNRSLEAGNKTKMFLTLLIAFYNFKTGELHYTNAGHNPPCILRKNGSLENFKAKPQALVGIIPRMKFVSEVEVLNPGDSLFIYTDGVIDTTSPSGERFGLHRFKDLLQNLQNENMNDYLPILLNSLKDFSAPEQKDDITILYLHRS